MKQTIQILRLSDLRTQSIGDVDVKEVAFESSQFPGGEQFVRIDPSPYNIDISKKILIETRLNSGDDIMQLLMATDALKRLGVTSIVVIIPYIPYARQDRVCTEGESHSLKAFATLINAQNYEAVICLDPHSHVCEAVFDNLVVKSNNEYVKYTVDQWYDYNQQKISDSWLISPDAGALKKIYDISKDCGFDKLAIGEKVRNLATGEIIRTDINVQEFEGRDCWIVDDICDGGRTFIELAKVLRERNAGKIFLFVTHGIFSKGLEVLEPWFDGVFTTDTVKTHYDYMNSEGGMNFSVIEICTEPNEARKSNTETINN